ncbi:uncharacterized protein E0L32_007119 [Thyridium curvatum]|uniref:RING-type domain-containing protein n=1 Tax=Thyridium curvatum TaxID=1093900 RepID=A0A507AWZ5_9PEZI|nr:uncharacterized protein E0L32_007119 [Thyridium curvatum]TPX12233.1 hypothetical protein E0L32_007119 [Thyridium curvatum]
MSSAPSNLGKSLSAPVSASHSPAPPASQATSSFESVRRPSSQAGSSPSYSAPRKGQASRKQHRNQKKPGHRQVDEDDAMAEIRALRNASSRRGQTSITHLMNYSLPPRPYQDHHHYGGGGGRGGGGGHNRSYRRNPAWGQGSGHHAMDKARYVHANYRFVVSPAGDYSTHALDADEHLDWADVLQILASAESQAGSCPICLSEPVAPRMAKCGHIFCLPCLIRFMNSTADDDEAKGPAERRAPRWKKCPICEDSIYISEVRPVRFYAGQESPLPRPGDDVVLRLMLRNAKSTLALPREGGADVLTSASRIPWHFAANVLDYARIMRGTGTYMAEQYDREIEDLIRQEKEDELMFHEDGEWTQKAIRSIKAAIEKVESLGGIELALADDTAKTAVRSTSKDVADHAEQDFYFYTSPPHLYLSPLDIRILKTKYGSFSSFPSTLLPRVEHISTGHVVDDAMRRRAKYLGHLPRGCLISFLECDWTDIVPADILAAFADEIERRRKRNRDKAVQEERERQQAERIEAAALREARRNFGALDDGAVLRYSDEAMSMSSAAAAPQSDAAVVVDLNDFQPLGSAAAPGSTPPNHPRHGFAHLADMSSTSPPSANNKTVWGTPAVPVSPSMVAQRQVPRGDVDDGWLKDDQFLDTLGGDADLALQMEALGVVEAGDEAGAQKQQGASGGVAAAAVAGAGGGAAGGLGAGGGVGGGGAGAGAGGKKKKKQKITLMSTGGRRGL